MPELSAQEWDEFLSSFPHAHLLQTTPWGELKSAFGWEVRRICSLGQENGAQLLFRRLPSGLAFAYIPKGPLGEDWDKLLPDIDRICRQRPTVFLKVEPDRWEQSPTSPAQVNNIPPGFRQSPHAIQPRQTLIVDLSGDEEHVLARMKQKTRYNIRLAQKKGVKVHPSADLEAFYRLMLVTGGRDNFGVHSLEYYQRAYDLFHPRSACELLMAEFEGETLGGLLVFAHSGRAWYLFGASADSHRDRMPTYLLQWEAMRWARSLGCTEYDLWGIPDAPEEILEKDFKKRTNSLWGVYRFKRGFGGQIRRSAGPWDRIYRPSFYALYRLWSKWGLRDM